MQCPRCAFNGEISEGCPRCGYKPVAMTPIPVSLSNQRASSSYSLESQFAYSNLLRNGRYRLLHQLALPENQQDQGIAWLATMRPVQQTVILREVVPPAEIQLAQVAASVVERFKGLPAHPGLPRLIDAFSENNRQYLVFPLVGGESLGTYLRRQGGTLPEQVAREFGLQLCEILEILGSIQPAWIHGAISLETLVVNADSRVISLLHLPPFSPHQSVIKRNISHVGYMAPEQVRGQVRPSSDLYAVAAILHHAITGSDPDSRMAFFYPPARKLNPMVTPAMEAVLARQLRLSVQDRYAHASDMKKDLATVQAGPSESKESENITDEEIPEDPTSDRASKRLAIGIFVALGALLIFAFIFVFFYLLR